MSGCFADEKRMNGNNGRSAAPIELKREGDFVLGAMTVRPSASEIVVDGETQRVEPRVMQTLVALFQARGDVVSRDDLMARCWHGSVVSEDAVTRAAGQVRRLSRRAPGSFTLQTIAKIGYRLIPADVPLSASQTVHVSLSRSRAARFVGPLGVTAAAAVVLFTGLWVLQPTLTPPTSRVEPDGQLRDLGTTNADAHDRYLRAKRLLDVGGRDNTLRAEQLLREALELDPEFHAAKESLAIALLSAAAFVPARAGAAHAEFAGILESETVDTPLAWRGHVMRGFQHVFAGNWRAAERALANARDGAPGDAFGAVAALQTALYGSVGRVNDSLELVMGQGRTSPFSRDQSRVVQQWLDRLGRHDEAEAEYARSRDLPGDRSAMELAAVVRALGQGGPDIIKERYRRYRETDWGRPGDDELFAVLDTPTAALDVLTGQITDWRTEGSMPPFFAAAWASYYGDQALAIEGLRASPESLFSTGGLLWEPVFAETRRTAAFKTLVRDFGYVDYWLQTGAWGDFCRPVGDNDFECT
jgi:DNA-binding winged helix-turn-helix (wHTH) protein